MRYLFMRKHLLITTMLLLTSLITACAPEVGSEEWCKEMKQKDKGDWTVNQTKDYINYCVMDNKKED
jgi:hypothetical protein